MLLCSSASQATKLTSKKLVKSTKVLRMQALTMIEQD